MPAGSSVVAAARGARPRGWLVALVLFVAGAALRVHGVADLSITGDEIYTIWETRSARAAATAAGSPLDAWLLRARLAFGSERLDAPGLDPKAAWRLRWAWRTNPLQLLLNEGAFELFGDSPLAARAFPLLFGVAALIVLPLMMRRLAGERAALLLLALLALCPAHVLMSKLARYESMSLFLGGVAALAAANFARERRRRDEVVSLVASGLLVASHVTGALVAATLVFQVALLLRGRIARVVLPIAAAAGVALLAFGSLGRVVATIDAGVGSPRVDSPWWRIALSLLYNVGPAVAALAAVALLRARRAALAGVAPIASALLIPAVALLALACWRPIGVRYFAPCSACAVALAALGAEALFRIERTRRSALPALVVALLSQLPLLASDWIDGQRYDYAAAAAELERLTRPDDAIVGDWGGILDFYLKGRAPVADLPRSVDALDRKLRESGAARAFVVLERQRGRLVWSGDAAQLEGWLARNGHRVATLGPLRLDHPLYRFELELDEVDLEALRCSPPR
jgi:dolichyl-phosphate-mannose-protein mannosyltransferase